MHQNVVTGINGLRDSLNDMIVSKSPHLSTTNNKKGNKNNSGKNHHNKSPITPKPVHHRSKAFGEFRHFQERQVAAAPVCLKINKRVNVAQGFTYKLYIKKF